jgi:mannan endo-1,4-beta-mannosidase
MSSISTVTYSQPDSFGTSTPAPFLQVSGANLVLNNRVVKPTGFNYYWAASSYTLANLKATLSDWSTSATATPMMLRFWAFQSFATVGGVRNWTAIDTVLQACDDLGLLAVPVLGNMWPDFDTAGQKDITWFQANGGYTTIVASDSTTTYKQYCADFAARYKNRTCIGIINLMNEPDARNADNTCPSETAARDALISFASDMASTIRAQDPNHLIMLGCQGSGQCGMRGTSWKSVMSATGNQVAEYHDYYADNVPIGGDATNGEQRHLDDANAIPMPLLVGECGANRGTNSTADLNTRRDNVKAKIDAQFAAGADGFLVWDWWNISHDGAEDEIYNAVTGDPMIPMLQAGG